MDDRAENVEAAIDFGFHGHMHRDAMKLERMLRKWNLTDKQTRRSDRTRLSSGQGRS